MNMLPMKKIIQFRVEDPGKFVYTGYIQEVSNLQLAAALANHQTKRRGRSSSLTYAVMQSDDVAQRFIVAASRSLEATQRATLGGPGWQGFVTREGEPGPQDAGCSHSGHQSRGAQRSQSARERGSSRSRSPLKPLSGNALAAKGARSADKNSASAKASIPAKQTVGCAPLACPVKEVPVVRHKSVLVNPGLNELVAAYAMLELDPEANQGDLVDKDAVKVAENAEEHNSKVELHPTTENLDIKSAEGQAGLALAKLALTWAKNEKLKGPVVNASRPMLVNAIAGTSRQTGTGDTPTVMPSTSRGFKSTFGGVLHSTFPKRLVAVRKPLVPNPPKATVVQAKPHQSTRIKFIPAKLRDTYKPRSKQAAQAERDAAPKVYRPRRRRKRFPCPLCQRKYASTANLERHKQTHRSLNAQNLDPENPDKHKCEECGKVFAQPSYLQAHIRTHATRKAFKCDWCSKSFVLQSYLNKHVAGAHYEELYGDDAEDSCSTDESQYTSP